MFKYFKDKKEAKEKAEYIERSTFLYNSGRIDRATYLNDLANKDEAAWLSALTATETMIINIKKQYNRGEIDKETYKENIKLYDIDAWLKLATEDEKILHNLETQYANGMISDREYDKSLADINKEPFVDFAEIKFNDDGRHSVELDFNSYFVAKLREVGHVGETDDDVVNSWFVAFCASIAAESDAVIISNPEDIQKVNYEKKGNKSEYR